MKAVLRAGMICALSIALVHCASEPGTDASVDAASSDRTSIDSQAPIDGSASIDSASGIDSASIDDVSEDPAPLPDVRVAIDAGTSDGGSPMACSSAASCGPAAACQQVACIAGRCVSSAQSCSVAPSRTLAAACPAGAATFSVSLGGACGGSCAGSTCAFTARTAPCVSANVSPNLTLYYADEALVWDWLRAQSAASFTLARPRAPLSISVPASADELFALWVRLGPRGSNVSESVELDGLQVPPEDFTLARMQVPAMGMTPAALNAYLQRFDMLADWAQWNVTGNPYYNDPAVLRRAFVTAFIALVRAEGGSFGGASDTPENFAMITRGFWLLRGVAVAEALASAPAGATAVPACVQAAYHQLLARYFDRLASGPLQRSESNTDMYTPILAALYRTARVLNDEARVQRAAARARELLTTSGLYHSAGYLHHGYDETGFDASYEGITRFFVAHAAIETRDRPEFDLLRATHAQMVDLRQYTTFFDRGHASPFVGPSHFSPATAAPSARDQWSYLPRMVAQAALDEDAFWPLTRAGFNLPTEANLRSDVMTRLSEVNAQLTMSRAVTLANIDSADHFHTRPNYATRYDLRGLFTRLRAAVGTAREQLPCERDTMSTVRLGDDFTFVRRPTYGALVHWGMVSRGHDSSAVAPAMCNSASAMGCTNTVRVGPDGFGGGALSAFYAPGAGALIMGLGHGMQNDQQDRNAWGEGLPVRYRPTGATPMSTDAWWRWPTHAFAGRTAAGRPFSSARVQRPTVTRSADEQTITVQGSLSCPAGAVGCSADPTATLNGALTYTRVFTAQPTGLSVETTFRYTRADTPVDQLVEMLPIHLGQYSGSGASLTLQSPVTVQFIVAGAPVAASTSFVANVTAVVIQRAANGVRVEFASPQRVRLTAALSPLDPAALWLNSYQWRVAATNLQIDLRNGATTIPASGGVRYVLRAF